MRDVAYGIHIGDESSIFRGSLEHTMNINGQDVRYVYENNIPGKKTIVKKYVCSDEITIQKDNLISVKDFDEIEHGTVRDEIIKKPVLRPD